MKVSGVQSLLLADGHRLQYVISGASDQRLKEANSLLKSLR